MTTGPPVDDRIPLLESDALFDDAYYSQRSGIVGERNLLVRHYLEFGESAMLSPSAEFSPAFYRLTNPDVVAAGMSSLAHFIRRGRAEHRYPNRRRLRADAETIERSGLFDFGSFRRAGVSARPGFSAVETYLLMQPRSVSAGIDCDEDFYAAMYDDVGSYSRRPLIHYVEVGRLQARVGSPADLRERVEVLAPHFSASYYCAQLPAADLPQDPLRHYVLHGAREGRDASPDLSSDYYLRSNPDVAGSHVDPFVHFVRSGRSEGRVARLDGDEWFSSGERAVDPSKPTIAVASHDASRTGAPFVCLALVGALSERYNVVVALGEGGPLEDRFRAFSVAIVSRKASPLEAEYILAEMRRRYGVFAIVLNSVETSEFAPAALHAGIPSVALVHEFAEYVTPHGKVTGIVEAADVVVVASELVRESLNQEVVLHRLEAPNNVVVRHQGRPIIPPDEHPADHSYQDLADLLGIRDRGATRIVLGAGSVIMRKGVDLFVQTADEVRRTYGDAVRFLWVGDRADADYSFWLEDMVRKLHLEQHVVFIAAQSDLRTLFELADVFYLSSRLDPYPNVMIEAFFAGKPVVCFEDATSFAEELRHDSTLGRLARYGNVADAARAIVELFAQDEGGAKPDRKPSLAARFDFSEYAKFVEHQIWRACSLRAHTDRVAERVLASGAFDSSFHEGTPCTRAVPEARRAALSYAARGVKALTACNPRPGFHEGYYRSQDTSAASRADPPLIRALDRGGDVLPTTHRCVVLEPGIRSSAPIPRIAVHLHLHYPELAAEFVARFAQAGLTADLCITTTSARSRTSIARAFRSYGGGSVEVLAVANRGRDLGPMLTTMPDLLGTGRYDVIGHLHGKRSLDVGSEIGDRWRAYLLDTLLGDASHLAGILRLFADDPTLGLLFPEDRRSVGWTKNLPFAEDLARVLTPTPAVPRFPVFPIGSMFWARPAALRSLWDLGLRSSDLPPEPLPYDGSMIHAIEQILPAVCEAAGLSWCTVYRPPLAW